MSGGEGTEWHVTTEAVSRGEHGKDYEKEIAKFLFKRLVDGNFKNFKFTREKRGLGKFDDLIYLYEIDGGRKKLGLLQLKHISDTSKTIGYEALTNAKNSYFLLPKYFEYYLESMKTIDEDFADAELEGLFLCTNIGLEDDLRGIQKQQIDNDGLFKDSGVLYKLTISSADKRHIFEQSYISKRKRLANELTYSIMCNKHIDINDLKNNDHVSMLKTYHVALAKDVIDVKTKKFQTDFLDKHSQNSELGKFRHSLFESVSEFYEKYKDFSADELGDILKIGSNNSKELKNRLSSYKSLNSAQEFLKEETIKFGKSFGDSMKFPNDDIELPAEEVNADEVDIQISHFLDKLILTLEQSSNENITRKEIGELDENIFSDYNDRMKKWYDEGSYEGKDSEGSVIRKRDWLTKEKLVSDAMETTIKFQGRNLKLKQLVSDQNLLDPNLLMRIFCSSSVNIGNKIRGITDPTTKYCYITRVLTKQKAILKSVLTSGGDDIFVLSHVKDDLDKEQVKEFIPKSETLDRMENITDKSRFIFTGCDFEAKDFDNFVGTYSEEFKWTNVHWLKYEGDNLIWERTHGSELELRNFFTNDHTFELVNESDLCKNNRIAILTGEPGMGKSTLIDQIAENFAKNDGEKEIPDWIIKISLKDCDKILNEIESLENLDGVAQFISFFENVENNFGKNLLKHYFANENRVILLFDGFDELQSKDKRKKITECLKFLKHKSRILRIFITTRTHFKEVLEDCLEVIAHSIKEISEDEQIYFLTRYWTRKKEASIVDEKQLLGYTKVLIEKFNKSTNARDRSFLGIPLQTYMFAVAFHDEALKDNPDIPESLPITSLFEKFLNTKYDIYFERSGENINNKAYKLKWYDIHHQEFALLYGGIFPSDEAELFVTEDNLDENEILLLTEIGVIYKFNDTFHFTHKTFAEYLTVKLLVRVSSNPKRNNSNRRRGMANIFLKPGNEFLRYLFDLKLTENYPIHNSVLNGEDVKISDDEINVEDCLGRRPLNYAVRYRTFNFVRSMCDKGAVVGEDWEHWIEKSHFQMELDHDMQWRAAIFKKVMTKVLKELWRKERRKHHWKEPRKEFLMEDLKDYLKTFLRALLNEVVTELLINVFKLVLMVFLLEVSNRHSIETLKQISKVIWEDTGNYFWESISRKYGGLTKEVVDEFGMGSLKNILEKIPDDFFGVILKAFVEEAWKEVWEEDREKVWNNVWDDVGNQVLNEVSRGSWVTYLEKDWDGDSEKDFRRIGNWFSKAIKDKIREKNFEDLKLNT